MFPMPATSDWSSSVSPSVRAWSARRRAARASRRGRAARRGCRARGAASARVWSSSTGPPQSTPSSSSPRRTSHGRPRCATRRAGARVQRPLMRRCERSTTPPSKRSTRFLPTASTDSSRRPSSCSATRVACARGCGDSTSSCSPTSGWSRAAARWSVSPSGTRVGEEPLRPQLEPGDRPVGARAEALLPELEQRVPAVPRTRSTGPSAATARCSSPSPSAMTTETHGVRSRFRSRPPGDRREPDRRRRAR